MKSLVKTFHDYKLEITVITPLHIGSGESASVLNSLEYGDYIYGFTLPSLIKNLTSTEISSFKKYFENYVKQYREANSKPKQYNNIGKKTASKPKAGVKRKADECPSTCPICTNYGDDCELYYKDTDTDCEIYPDCISRKICINKKLCNDCRSYKSEGSFIQKIKQIATYTIHNPHDLHDKQQELLIRSATGIAYIPGSSLKGAIISAFEKDYYLSVGDAIPHNKKLVTTLYQRQEQSIDSHVTYPQNKTNYNSCEMFDIDTTFECHLRTQDNPQDNLTIDILRDKLRKHYQDRPAYKQMEQEFKDYLEAQAPIRDNPQDRGYDFIMPLGKYKGREFNLDQNSYKTRLSATNKLINQINREGLMDIKQINRQLIKDGISLKRRIIKIDTQAVPIGWIGVKITAVKGG